MSEYNWYSLEKMLYENKNNGRNSRHTQNVYFRDFINHFKSNPENFTPKMVLELNIAIVAKVNKILTKELESSRYRVSTPKTDTLVNLEKEHYKELVNIASKHLESESEMKGLSWNKPSIHTFATNFESDINTYSAAGKKNYISEFRIILEDLSLFKDTSWYHGINSSLLFSNVNIKTVPSSIGSKKFLLSLEKFFPFLKGDDLYKSIKDDFFEKYYTEANKQANHVFFHYNPLNEIFSFVKDSYNEEILKKVESLSKGITAYSYLKHKSAVDKIMDLYPESKEILKDYINEIKEDSVGDIFRENSYKIIYINIDFKEVEKILLLDKVKSASYDIKEKFQEILTDKQNKNNPLSWYFNESLVENSSKNPCSSLLFKINNNDYEKIGEDLIKKFIKNQFLSFVNEYPKKQDVNKYESLWQEFLIKKEVESLPLKENHKSNIVKKF